MGNCGFRCSDVAGCAEPTCASPKITCNNLAKGWQGATCQKFTADEDGKCRNGGLCTSAGDSAYCTGNGSPAASCVDQACRDTTKCIKGTTAPSTASAVCFEDGVQHLCPNGEVCSTNGECLLDQGESCNNNNECHTGHCMRKRKKYIFFFLAFFFYRGCLLR